MRFAILIYLVFSFSSAFALDVTAITLEAQRGGQEIEILLGQHAEAKIFTLNSPPRLVVDLPFFRWRAVIANRSNEQENWVKNVRHAKFSAETSRIVFDLKRPAQLSADTLPRQNARRLILKLVAASAPPATSLPVASMPVALPTSQKPAKSEIKKPLIVIDAGHGGQDPGASGASQTHEKHVTLRYAKALADSLRRSGKFEVKLTREDDRFILLRERYKIAQQAKADLFLSLHADSAPNRKARGLSIYTLSEQASDAEAAQLAQQENKADLLADVDLSHENKEVADILLDLARRETKNKSIKLAETIVKNLKSQVKLLSNPHRFAGFAVLKAPDIPSALIELGFLTNPQEEKLIQSEKYRDTVVRSLTGGISRYFAQISDGRPAR